MADFLTYYFFIEVFLFDYFYAGIYGYIIGVFVNYILARQYVFSKINKLNNLQELMGIYLVSFFGLLIHQVSIYSLVELTIINIYYSKIIASFIVLFWNFYAKKIFIYRERL